MHVEWTSEFTATLSALTIFHY